MADYKYKGATPVDEPVSKPAKAPAPAASSAKGKDYKYPDSTPVDEPVAKKYAKGGKIDGIAQRGKTRGKVV